MSYAAGPVKREAILDAMQDRLDWLRANPSAPLMEWGTEVLVSSDRGEVTTVAALASQPREELAAGCRVIVRFGAGVSYVAFAAEQAKTEAVAA